MRYQTDARLWAWFTLALLAASWCVPVLSIKGPYFSIATTLKEWVVAVYHREGSLARLVGIVFVFYAVCSLFLATVFGWVLHCVVVIVRARRRERKAHAEQWSDAA
jgi:hypothetical protein